MEEDGVDPLDAFMANAVLPEVREGVWRRKDRGAREESRP